MPKPDESPHPPAGPPRSDLRRYAGMGTEFFGAVCGLTLAGYWIDRRFGTGKKATLICAGLGLVGGMYNFIRQAMAMSRESQRDYRDAHRGSHDDDANSPRKG